MNTLEESSSILPQSCITTLYDLIDVRGFLCTDGLVEKSLDRLQGRQQSSISCPSSKSSEKHQQSLRIVFYRGLKTVRKEIEKEIQRLTPKKQLLIVHILVDNDKRLDENFRELDDRVTYYTEGNISQNILHHKWVPLHQKIDERETKYITKVYNLHHKAEQLPLISIEDPVVAFHGWRCGDIIKIIRKPLLCPRSGPASKHIGSGCGSYVSYRYVTKIREE